MKIALLGYGRMGKSIEAIALQRDHSISLKVSDATSDYDFSDADVAIDFSIPSVAVFNIKKALDAGIPVISGTTGWLDHYDEVIEYCNTKKGTFLYASNFSLGVNFAYQFGGYGVDNTYIGLLSGEAGENLHKDVFKTWTLDNQTATLPLVVPNNDLNYYSTSNIRLIEYIN